MKFLLNPARLVAFLSLLVLAVPAQAAQALDKAELRKVLRDNPDIVVDVLKDNPKMIKQALGNILNENPDLIFDVLRANSIEILEVAQQGARDKQRLQMTEQWQKDLTQPKKVNYNRPVLGDPKAPVTIVAYSDFTCQFCAQTNEVMRAVLSQKRQQARLIFKNFPKSDDALGRIAAQYSKAAFAQDEKKGWEYIDAVFAGQKTMLAKGEDFLLETAEKVGLDPKRMTADANSSKIKTQVEEDMAEATSVGAPGTPFHLVNDLTVRGAAPLSSFLEAVDLASKEARKKK